MLYQFIRQIHYHRVICQASRQLCVPALHFSTDLYFLSGSDPRRQRPGMSEQPDQHGDNETHGSMRDGCLVMHPGELTEKEFGFLKELQEKLDVKLKKVDRKIDNKVIAAGNQPHVKKLTELQQHLAPDANYKRVILAFPKSFQPAQLVMAINEMMKCNQAFVTVLMYQNEYVEFPHDLDEFKIRRILIHKNMQDIEGIISELESFIKDDPEDLNLAFLNFGNGLTWSYYFGYLVAMLPELEKIISESEWRKGVGKDVPEENILKRMLIYPKVEIMKKDLKLGRLIFHKNEIKVNRAGIDRRYEIDIREVKSKDGRETYYCIADYANCLNMLIKLRDDSDISGLLDMGEEMMVKQGRYFAERLALFLHSGCMRKYNEKYNIHPSKFELQLQVAQDKEHYTPRSAPEEQLVDDLFERTKEALSVIPPVGLPGVPTEDIGIIFLPGPDVDDNIKEFGASLPKATRNLFGRLDLVAKLGILKKVFMVLTDDLVNSDNFEDVFYAILHRGYAENNRRLLVCLDCLTSATVVANHPALQLLLLFKRISHSDPEWKQKVKTELYGDHQEITYPLMLHNIGTGFALSYYYQYLKFRIPPMKNIVAGTPALGEKFNDRLMSYKLFILHPTSCKVEKKVSDADPRIIDRDDDEELKKIKFQDITNDRRFYSPKISSIIDPKTKKKYFVFVEYNTQAETLHRMMKEGFLDESLLSAEWARFCNKLNTIISHRNEPMGYIDRMQIISYDDATETDLAETILEKVKQEIEKENGVL